MMFPTPLPLLGPVGKGKAGAFTKKFVSTEQTITSAGALTIPHGLGEVPQLVSVLLKNGTTEANYSVGDEVFIQSGELGNVSRGISLVPDATNLNIRYGSDVNAFNVLDKTTGTVVTLTNTSWTMIVKAWA